jgi:hypothetical protein
MDIPKWPAHTRLGDELWVDPQTAESLGYFMLAFSLVEQRTSACIWQLLEIENVDAAHGLTSAIRDFGARINMLGTVGKALIVPDELQGDLKRLISALHWINSERNDLLHSDPLPNYGLAEEATSEFNQSSLLRVRMRADNAELRRKYVQFPAAYLKSLAAYCLTVKDALAAFTINANATITAKRWGKETSYRLRPPSLDIRPQRHPPDHAHPAGTNK